MSKSDELTQWSLYFNQLYSEEQTWCTRSGGHWWFPHNIRRTDSLLHDALHGCCMVQYAWHAFYQHGRDRMASSNRCACGTRRNKQVSISPSLVGEQGGHKEMSSYLADQQRPHIWAQMRGDRGGVVDLSHWVQLWHGAQLNLGDLFQCLTYMETPTWKNGLPHRKKRFTSFPLGRNTSVMTS